MAEIRASLEREVEVSETQLFLVAFADGVIGQMKTSGNLEGAGTEEETEFFTEGRLAFYLTGLVKGSTA